MHLIFEIFTAKENTKKLLFLNNLYVIYREKYNQKQLKMVLLPLVKLLFYQIREFDLKLQKIYMKLVLISRMLPKMKDLKEWIV